MSCVNPRSDLVSSVNETGLSLVLNMAPHWSWAYLCHLTEPTWCHRRSEWKWSVDVCTKWMKHLHLCSTLGVPPLESACLINGQNSIIFTAYDWYWPYASVDLWLLSTVFEWCDIITLHDDGCYSLALRVLAHGNDVWCGIKGCMHLRAYRPTCVNSAFPIGICQWV